MRCKQHKRYKAKLRPRIDCVGCWEVYLSQTATYHDICTELKLREPKEGGTYAKDFEPEPIMDMLREAKKELEQADE